MIKLTYNLLDFKTRKVRFINMYKFSNKRFKLKIVSLALTFLILFPVGISISQNSVLAAQHSSSLKPTKVAQENSQKVNLYGFTLQKTCEFENHPILYYIHEKTGAKIVVERNNNIDKKFQIGLRTPVQNNKGINHIIEHCVLDSSKKYPVKNLFFELTQNAYYTFLNATTYHSYTVYPVASMDEDELESLAKIYTDSVFNPKFLENEKIFKKEGIRYELDENEKFVANGTVFNEMQQENRIPFQNFLKQIFSDTQGKYDSGGIPEDIMDLTYEEVCETYKNYYHPSNSLICISGDVNYERFFKWLDEEYFSNFEKKDMSHVKYTHQDFANIKKYEVFNHYKKDTEKKVISANVTHILDSKILKNNLMNLRVVEALTISPAERVKTLLEKGYLEVAVNLLDWTYEPLVTIEFASTNPDLMTEKALKNAVDELLFDNPITQNEVDHIVKECDFEKTISKSTNIYDDCIEPNEFMQSYVKFGEPISDMYFNLGDKNTISTEIKKESLLTADNINETIKRIFNREHQIITVFKPINDEKLSLKHKINSKLQSMESEKANLTKNYEEQKKWAATKSPTEDLRIIKNKFKKLSEINVPKFSCELNQGKLSGKPYFESVQEIEDCASYVLVFKVNHMTPEDIKYLEILEHAWNANKTNQHTRSEFEKIKAGKMILKNNFVVKENINNEKNAFIILRITTQKDNLDDSVKYLKEQLFDVNFKDKQSLKEYLDVTIAELQSTPSALKKFNEAIAKEKSDTMNYLTNNCSMEEFEEFLAEMQNNIDDDTFLDEIATKLSDLRNKLINYSSLYVCGACSSKNNQKNVKNNIENFVNSLKVIKTEKNKPLEFFVKQSRPKSLAYVDKGQSNNEVYKIFDSKILNKDAGFQTACKFITSLFLLNQIREKGGAYGARIYASDLSNKIVLSSFRDPNLRKTLKTYDVIPDFIKTSNLTQQEIDAFSKTCLGSLFEDNKLRLAMNQILTRICENDDYCGNLNKNIEKIKNITKEDIKNYGTVLENELKNANTYVLTGKMDDADKDLFDVVYE